MKQIKNKKFTYHRKNTANNWWRKTVLDIIKNGITKNFKAAGYCA